MYWSELSSLLFWWSFRPRRFLKTRGSVWLYLSLLPTTPPSSRSFHLFLRTSCPHFGSERLYVRIRYSWCTILRYCLSNLIYFPFNNQNTKMQICHNISQISILELRSNTFRLLARKVPASYTNSLMKLRTRGRNTSPVAGKVPTSTSLTNLKFDRTIVHQLVTALAQTGLVQIYVP